MRGGWLWGKGLSHWTDAVCHLTPTLCADLVTQATPCRGGRAACDVEAHPEAALSSAVPGERAGWAGQPVPGGRGFRVNALDPRPLATRSDNDASEVNEFGVFLFGGPGDLHFEWPFPPILTSFMKTRRLYQQG